MEFDRSTALKVYTLMQRARTLEERLIKLYRTGDSFFWIGGPGEEAFGVPLGLLAKVGEGLDFDYFHLHYRCTPTLIALGMPMIDSVRLMLNRQTDTCTKGRNFSSHYCFPKWNVTPVTSPIGVQYGFALGTALAQKRAKGNSAISIVTGGDAGTAEADFATALIWSSRKGSELPMLMTVQNNRWGISTRYEGQHALDSIARRGDGHGIKNSVIDGNDVEATYFHLQSVMEYIRKERQPYLLEVAVSRLYGHSSASGANRDLAEPCCLDRFAKVLKKRKWITDSGLQSILQESEEEALQASQIVRQEPHPVADSVWEDVYFENENADWRKF